LWTKADVQEYEFTQGPFGIILRKVSQFRCYPLERASKEVPGHEIGDLQRALLKLAALERQQRMPYQNSEEFELPAVIAISSLGACHLYMQYAIGALSPAYALHEQPNLGCYR